MSCSTNLSVPYDTETHHRSRVRNFLVPTNIIEYSSGGHINIQHIYIDARKQIRKLREVRTSPNWTVGLPHFGQVLALLTW